MNKLSFSFKKKEEKPEIKQAPSQFVSKDDDDKKDEKEFITAICNNKIESKNKPIEKKELVIELKESKRRKLLYKKRENQDLEIDKKENEFEIKNENKSADELEDELNSMVDDKVIKNEIKNEFDLKRVKKEIEKVEESSNTVVDYDELARRELLRQATGEEIKEESNLIIKPAVKNEIKDEKNDSDEEVEDADYDAVKPEDFSMALLRGMTKNHEELKNTKFYVPKTSSSRGVGLGFESQMRRDNISKSKIKQSKRYLPGQDDDDDNDLIKKTNTDELVDDEIKLNSLVCIEHGKEKVGRYGKVVSIDEEVTRCEVELSLSKEIVTLPIILLRAVSKKEYDKESIVINKSKLVEYKNKSEDKKKDPKSMEIKNSKYDKEDKYDDRRRYDHRHDKHDRYDRYEDRRSKNDKSDDRRNKYESGRRDRYDKYDNDRKRKYDDHRRDR